MLTETNDEYIGYTEFIDLWDSFTISEKIKTEMESGILTDDELIQCPSMIYIVTKPTFHQLKISIKLCPWLFNSLQNLSHLTEIELHELKLLGS